MIVIHRSWLTCVLSLQSILCHLACGMWYYDIYYANVYELRTSVRAHLLTNGKSRALLKVIEKRVNCKVLK